MLSSVSSIDYYCTKAKPQELHPQPELKYTHLKVNVTKLKEHYHSESCDGRIISIENYDDNNNPLGIEDWLICYSNSSEADLGINNISVGESYRVNCFYDSSVDNDLLDRVNKIIPYTKKCIEKIKRIKSPHELRPIS